MPDHLLAIACTDKRLENKGQLGHNKFLAITYKELVDLFEIVLLGTKIGNKSLDLVMMKYTTVLENPQPTPRAAIPEPLLREALGAALRAFRADKGITLRELAEASRVSPGYLSELERGRKEVSSELLASVCHALDATVADVLIEAAGSMAMKSAEVDLARVSS